MQRYLPTCKWAEKYVCRYLHEKLLLDLGKGEVRGTCLHDRSGKDALITQIRTCANVSTTYTTLGLEISGGSKGRCNYITRMVQGCKPTCRFSKVESTLLYESTPLPLIKGTLFSISVRLQ